MIVDEKQISNRILIVLKQKQPQRFKNVTQSDIRRIVRYYVKMIMLFERLGYCIRLSTYYAHSDKRCIYIANTEKQMAVRQYRVIIRQKKAFHHYKKRMAKQQGLDKIA